MTVYCLLIHVLRFSFSSTRSLDRLFGYPLYPIPFTYYIALLFLGSFPSPTRLLTRGSFTHPPTLPYPTLPYLPLARSLAHSLTQPPTNPPTYSLYRALSHSGRLSVLAFNCFLFLAVSVFIYLRVKPS